MNNSTYIAEISYQIENWLHEGQSNSYINDKIELLKDKNLFPSNLVFVDAYYDSFYGSSGCAFLDTNTGETIIGFAGTNQNNGWEQTGNDFITDGIGLGVTGINPNSLYMKKANDFIEGLKEKKYNITQTTGHSLGGALCVLAGLNHDIPLVVTYNGAPLYGLATAELTGVAADIRKLYSKYNGRIIRFVSDEDWLNPLGNSVNGLYYGDEYMLYNGRGHDIKHFNDSDEQTFIAKILQETLNNHGNLSVDFENDNKIDICLTENDLYVKNLFGVNGLYSGNGTEIKISPETFYNLQHNLKSGMVENDFAWISNAIIKCREKNEFLKNTKNSRNDILIQRVAEGLKQAHLLKIMQGIKDSHGALLKQKCTISTLADFNTYSVTRKFDMWGSSGGRKWFLDGVRFDEYDLINSIKKLKDSANFLYQQITSTGEFLYYNSYLQTVQVYKYDTLSDIGNSYAAVANTFLEKSKQVFDGTGLRSGKNDGIVNAISEVLEFELKNAEEMKRNVESLSTLAGGLADNFSKMDMWLHGKIKKGEAVSGFRLNSVSQNYKAYLQENKIFDDVKDVLEAYDLQVEEATANLSKSLVTDFTDLIDRSNKKLSKIYTNFEKFINDINSMNEKMNGNVTSTRTQTKLVGLNQWKTKEIKDYHGTLANLFPSEVVVAITNAKQNVNPILPNFTTTINYISMFNTQISQIKEYFNSIIEQAVYNSMELDTIIHAQMLISLRVKRMKAEITNIKQGIQSKQKGEALNNYLDLLNQLIKLFTYFDTMINDCFGTNTK